MKLGFLRHPQPTGVRVSGFACVLTPTYGDDPGSPARIVGRR